jgi:hypothetical protein
MVNFGTRSAVDPASSRHLRDAILSRHDVLRGLVAETVARTDARALAETDLDGLRARVRRLYQTVDSYLAFEEQALPPALRDVIGWGTVLQEQIEEDHRKLRVDLATALSALEPQTLSWFKLASDVRAFAAELLRDLDREDEALLNAQLDAIANDSEGG